MKQSVFMLLSLTPCFLAALPLLSSQRNLLVVVRSQTTRLHELRLAAQRTSWGYATDDANFVSLAALAPTTGWAITPVLNQLLQKV